MTELITMLELVPEGTTFKAGELLEWIRDNGGGGNAGSPQSAPERKGVTSDLTPHDIAELEKRSASTIQGWFRRGHFRTHGAYKSQGRYWRLPPAGYESWKEEQRARNDSETPAPNRRGSSVDALGSWREVRKRRCA